MPTFVPENVTSLKVIKLWQGTSCLKPFFLHLTLKYDFDLSTQFLRLTGHLIVNICAKLFENSAY
jgi:hypothetical protein